MRSTNTNLLLYTPWVVLAGYSGYREKSAGFLLGNASVI